MQEISIPILIFNFAPDIGNLLSPLVSRPWNIFNKLINKLDRYVPDIINNIIA